VTDERRVDGDRRSTPPPAELEALLEDMRELRLTFTADLTAAAGAADAGADDVVADILVGEQRELAGFARRSRTRLEALARQPRPVRPVATATPPRRWRRRAVIALPTVPLIAGLAVSAAAATGLLPLPASHPRPTTSAAAAEAVRAASAPATSTFHELETVLRSDPSASEVVAAATALHHQLEQLIAAAPDDPAGVSEVAKLLQMEQALLIRTKAPGSATVLAASRRLAARLVVIVASSSQPAPVYWSPSPQQHRSPTHTRPSGSPTTPAASTPSSAPTSTPASTSTPSPASTASPSPSSSDGPAHLPTLGN
jgi:hypothetical protein